MKKSVICLVALLLCACLLSGCTPSKEKVIIYSSSEDYCLKDMTQALAEKFPDYEIVIEYLSTGNHAARLLAEGKKTECDITHGLEYGYLAKLDNQGILADLSAYDASQYMPELLISTNFLPEHRQSGTVMINPELLKEKGLEIPTSYQDLLKPEYKGLVSMPNPKSSGTGYMFLLSLINAWGEQEAFDYFEALTPNVLQYTSSGSGAGVSLIQNEVAIALGLTGQAVLGNKEGANIEMHFFEEGSPYSMCGIGIVDGKQDSKPVQEIAAYIINEYNKVNNDLFYPEQIFTTGAGAVEGFPTNVQYADMHDDTIERKEAYLAQWKY